MRHRKKSSKLGKTTSHKRCMLANMLKSLIDSGRIKTTLAKAKELRKLADHMVTLAKKDTLASRRQAISELMITFNSLTPKERRAAKEGDISSYNTDRRVIKTLFSEIGPKFVERSGGYTRLIKLDRRIGDNSQQCLIEYL